MSNEQSTDINQRVAHNLAVILERKGINRLEAARRAGLNPTAVYDILSGKSASPRADTLDKIAKGIGVSLVSILEGEQVSSVNDDLRELAIVTAMLPEEERRTFLDLAEALAQRLAYNGLRKRAEGQSISAPE